MSNRYQFKTTLATYVNVFEDAGQYNNRGFKYTIPEDILAQLENEREELLDWCRTKAKGKVLVDFAPWERKDDGLVSYSYSNESRNPEPVFVDSDGTPVEKSVLRAMRPGTVVNMIVTHKPSMPPGKITTKLVVHGLQIIKLCTASGASDSGSFSEDEVTAMFGTVEGYKQDEPSVREEKELVSSKDSYDF